MSRGKAPEASTRTGMSIRVAPGSSVSTKSSPSGNSSWSLCRLIRTGTGVSELLVRFRGIEPERGQRDAELVGASMRPSIFDSSLVTRST